MVINGRGSEAEDCQDDNSGSDFSPIKGLDSASLMGCGKAFPFQVNRFGR